MKRILIVLSCTLITILFPLLFGDVCLAENGTELTTVVPCVVSLEDIENGAVWYDGISFTRDATIEIMPGTDLTLKLVPENGYQILQVLWNGVDVTKDIRSESLFIQGIQSNATLSVSFAHAYTSSATESVQTGDWSVCTIWIALAVFSFLVTIMLYRKRQEVSKSQGTLRSNLE